MNMVRSQHKSTFVSPPSRDYSQLATASQSGSKWPKRPRPKKKHPNLCSTMAHANHGPCHLHPTTHPHRFHLSTLRARAWFLLCWVVWSLGTIHTRTEVSVKSAELHAFKLLSLIHLKRELFLFKKDRRKTRVEWLTFLSESKWLWGKSPLARLLLWEIGFPGYWSDICLLR